MSDISPYLLETEDLRKHFPLKKGGVIKAVDGVTLRLSRGETLSVVGESGCGKSTLGRVILRLHDPTGGRVLFDGQDLMKLSPRGLRAKRKEMQMVFQDPFASLDTRQRVWKIITEPLVIHKLAARNELKDRARELLKIVGLDAEAADRFPHEFSGGQRQRIGIARAVAVNPKLIVADEPVSALDVSIQSQILNLLVKLRRELGLSYIFISHDLAVVKHISDSVAVMYLGRLAERADTDTLFSQPRHPYTEALLSAIPRLNPKKRGRRIILPGDIPDPTHPPPGCLFHPRCQKAMDVCRTETPGPLEVGTLDRSHLVWCHLYR
ncbi:MAG: oligopeptide/dipeptide ABC transporter ATP-binding protein [Thermodesulfobacteriota bacterium]